MSVNDQHVFHATSIVPAAGISLYTATYVAVTWDSASGKVFHRKIIDCSHTRSVLTSGENSEAH